MKFQIRKIAEIVSNVHKSCKIGWFLTEIGLVKNKRWTFLLGHTVISLKVHACGVNLQSGAKCWGGAFLLTLFSKNPKFLPITFLRVTSRFAMFYTGWLQFNTVGPVTLTRPILGCVHTCSPICCSDLCSVWIKPRQSAFWGPHSTLMAWHSGRTSVSDWRTFPVLCSTWVTTNVGKPSDTGQPTRPTQPFILSGSITE